MHYLTVEEQALVAAGIKMTTLQISAFEQELSRQPVDRRLRIMLAAFYSYREDAPDHLAKYQEHIGWLIKFEPSSGLLGDSLIYLKLRKAPAATAAFGAMWSDNLRRNHGDTKCLRHAAEFFTHFDLDTARQLLLRAKDIEPENGVWDALLTNLDYRTTHARWHMPGEELKLRIAKWRLRVEEARKLGDTELAEAALLRQRQFEQELLELSGLPVGRTSLVTF